MSLIRALHEDVNGDMLMNGLVQGIIHMCSPSLAK